MEQGLTDGQRLMAIGATMDAHLAQDRLDFDRIGASISGINTKIESVQRTIWLASGGASSLIVLAQVFLRHAG